MKQLLLFILLILAFLTAAKSHGRQYRLERELAGHWKVSFTSENHPWVERFWFRQRVLYWSIASITAVVLIVFRNRLGFSKNGKWQKLLWGLMTIGLSMIVAFVASGLLSWGRLALNLTRNPAPGSAWLENLHWISFGWWLLTVLLLILLLKFLKSEISNLKS